MENLFYCPKESILFWITFTDGENNTQKLIRKLTQAMCDFAEVARCYECDVNTEIVQESSAYRFCRVYSCKTERVPTNAFVLGDDWTVTQWLKR